MDTYVEYKQREVCKITEGYVSQVLKLTGGNISEAARVAGMDRATLHRLLRRIVLRRNSDR